MISLLLAAVVSAVGLAAAEPPSAEEKKQRKEEAQKAKAEKKKVGLRKHPAYELGKREAMIEAARQCAETGQVVPPPDPLAPGKDAPAPPVDFRADSLYQSPRARRIYVNGFYSCLRGHGLNPRYRDDLPIKAPPLPPPEDDLPAPTDAEAAYLDRNSRALWDDGAKQCEADLEKTPLR